MSLESSTNVDESIEAPSTADGAGAGSSRLRLAICLGLLLLTAAAYYRVAGCDFIPYDDPKYVYENPRVKNGLSFDNVYWALTTGYFANWHPMTWWSYMLDCHCFGARPGLMHVVNLAFHLANSVLLFLVLGRITGRAWPSAFVAAMFALHPLHVESVAWVSERKDVLSTFFWILTLGAYARYAARPAWGWYLLTVVCLALGLMSKAMLVTVPCVLLLLDYWPLGRMDAASTSRARRAAWLIFEKLPLFAMVAAVAVVTVITQNDSGSVATLEKFSLEARVANAAISYVTYLGKTFWPTRLAVFYPHPAMSASVGVDLNQWYLSACCAGMLLLGITATVLRLAARHRYLAVGWFWYLGTLVPVIGLVQVGSQAMADRYSYVPTIGLFIMAAWGVPELLRNLPNRTTVLSCLSAAAILGCLAVTWRQVGFWRNGVTLGAHAAAVTDNNYKAYTIMALALTHQGQFDAAIEHAEHALKYAPLKTQHAVVLYNHLGAIYLYRKNFAEGERYLRAALAVDPDFPQAHYNLGSGLADQGKYDEAKAEFAEAIRLDPGYARAHNNLGMALMKQEKYAESIPHFLAALAIDPSYTLARQNLQHARAK